MSQFEEEYYEIEELDLEAELRDEEKISTSKLNNLIKCRCFVEKGNKSTQTSSSDTFFDITVADDVGYMVIEEYSNDFDDETISSPSNKNNTICESFEANIVRIDKDEVNDEPESPSLSFDSNLEKIEVLNNDDDENINLEANSKTKQQSDELEALLLFDSNTANIEVNINNNDNTTKVESESDDDDGLPPLDDSLFVQPPVEPNCTKIDDYNYTCNICGQHFKQIPFFLRHYHIHQEFSMLCEECGFYGPSRSTVRFHHYNIKRYGNCKLTKNKTLSEFKRHSNFQAKNCIICGKKFSSGLKLHNHLNVHTKERPYICSCASRFGNSENFYTHLNRFKCPREGRIIPEYAPGSLLHFMPDKRSKSIKTKIPSSDKQKMAHGAEKQTKNSIESEEKIEGNKYFCEHCGQKFTKARSLRVHNEQEHMELKFSCSACSRKFAKKGILNTHIKMSHIENRKCVDCNLTFTPIKYKCHMRSRHKNKTNQKKLNVSNIRMIDINEDKSKYKCSICKIDYYIKSYSKHFQSRKHLDAEKIWKLRNKINRFSCRKCTSDPDGYDFIGEFLRHKIVFHGWYLRRNLEDFLKSFEEIKPIEECSRETP